MIEKIPFLPDNVLGFTAKGTVTAKDYESVINPAVEAQFTENSKVRFLYHLGKDFTEFESGAMWDDAKLGLKHPLGWEKIAVVSDFEWIKRAIRVFGLVIPGQIRVFNNDELDEAVQWISE